MLCLPRLSESAWRSVASVTNPSETSSLPIGWLHFICSSKAMRNWSSERMPSEIRIWPSGRRRRADVLMSRSACRCGGQFGLPFLDARPIECRRATLGGFQCQLVMLAGQAGLAQMIQADRQVEQVVRVVAIGGNCVEIHLLCLRPATLSGIQVAQCEME